MPSDEGEDKIVVLGQSGDGENWYMRTYNPDCDDSETLGQMRQCSRTAFVAIKGPGSTPLALSITVGNPHIQKNAELQNSARVPNSSIS
nr:unnamed protein product [Spirometra erinaceieuropaei]